jgi:hypothetical protein
VIVVVVVVDYDYDHVYIYEFSLGATKSGCRDAVTSGRGVHA